MTGKTTMIAQEPDCLRDCERLVIGSYSLMDLGDYAGCAALFAEDAVWVRGGKPVSGRDAILASLNRRPADQITRHIISNIMIQQTAADAAEATAVFVPLRGTAGPSGFAPGPQFNMIGDLAYRFVKREGAWQILHLQPKPVFKE